MPLPAAVCKLIYTFCKIRGEKVIVRFLNVETKYLELLLSALEEAERYQDSEGSQPQWTWEERYVVLLWLSHLMLAPFDLSTISSVYMEDVDISGVLGFFWPSNIPGITIRILPLAVKYLACPGRERDAAKALLVRMAMRRDMQQLGVTNALMQWALFWLTPGSDASPQSPYKYIGVLAFLAGILASSAETSDMEKYLSTVFYAVSSVSSGDAAAFEIIKSSALAKKATIKVIRSIAVSKLRRDKQDMAGIELVEATIGHLLERLGDNDTPVRLAASKALSIITLKLPEDMASQVVEAVLEALKQNVRWVKNQSDPSLPPARDLSSVDPLEWHGLMLTLSHLLYRRSPPPGSLRDIIQALLRGLAFEQRSASGGSIGSNVRDAACFGIWALARRYTTEELLAVPTGAVVEADTTKVTDSGDTKSQDTNTSVLQAIATQLVVTAALDPAGNIRRGSSAALQELIGRHPNTVDEGIEVVQTVDYHSVALRSKAMREVALGATQLHLKYGEALLEGLLGWRGIGDANPVTRRLAGLSYGAVTAQIARMSSGSFRVLSMAIEAVIQSIGVLQIRQVEERHGLMLALASVLDQLPEIVRTNKHNDEQWLSHLTPIVQRALSSLDSILNIVNTTTFRRPELIVEATCQLFISYFPVLEAATLGLDAAVPTASISGPDLLSPSGLNAITHTISRLDEGPRSEDPLITRILNQVQTNLHAWLSRTETEVTQAASDASVVLSIFLNGAQQRDEMVAVWAELIRPRSRSGSQAGHLLALTKSYATVVNGDYRNRADLICGSLLERWSQDYWVTVREWILQSLVDSEILPHRQKALMPLISEGLEDYTTNSKGDVGSHVRLQAIKATRHLWSLLAQSGSNRAASQSVASSLLLPILRLAAEKLDRVRAEAQSTLALALAPGYVLSLCAELVYDECTLTYFPARRHSLRDSPSRPEATSSSSLTS